MGKNKNDIAIFVQWRAWEKIKNPLVVQFIENTRGGFLFLVNALFGFVFVMRCL